MAFLIGIISGATIDEPNRPQYHFLPASNWMNDPNGPYFDEVTGLFHLMYQYETPRLWGHAVSSDLVDWDIVNIALNYSSAWYTEVPGETAGVYSGSATQIVTGVGTEAEGTCIWLTASTPTNDMMLLAYGANQSDPLMQEWVWDPNNPVIFSAANASDGSYIDMVPPPGRDPTSAWACGADGNTFCLGYATQQSEGCPCNNISGFAVFSATYTGPPVDSDCSGAVWSAWTFEGYALQDSAGAVMWECPDFYPLVNASGAATGAWMLKFSIGQGPDYTMPWGDPGPRDYYVTGSYDPTNPTSFSADPALYTAAMARSKSVVWDSAAFYASKSFEVAGQRYVFGWLPEERPVNDDGSPWGWAGVQSLPRLVEPYMSNGSWYVRTPPVESVLTALRNCSTDPAEYASCLGAASYSGLTLTLSPEDIANGTTTTTAVLDATSGVQLEIIATVLVPVSDSNAVGLRVGLRVLGSALGAPAVEYTEVGLELLDSGAVALFVDPSMSCSVPAAQVNRTTAVSGAVTVAESEATPGFAEVELRVLVDHSVLESFLAGGAQAVTRRIYPADPAGAVAVATFLDCAAVSDPSSCSMTFANISTYVLRSAEITSSSSGGDDGNDATVFPFWGIILSVALGVALLVISGVGWTYVQRRNEKSAAEPNSMPLIRGYAASDDSRSVDSRTPAKASLTRAADRESDTPDGLRDTL